jgi:hypothetical protein
MEIICGQEGCDGVAKAKLSVKIGSVVGFRDVCHGCHKTLTTRHSSNFQKQLEDSNKCLLFKVCLD